MIKRVCSVSRRAEKRKKVDLPIIPHMNVIKPIARVLSSLSTHLFYIKSKQHTKIFKLKTSLSHSSKWPAQHSQLNCFDCSPHWWPWRRVCCRVSEEAEQCSRWWWNTAAGDHSWWRRVLQWQHHWGRTHSLEDAEITSQMAFLYRVAFEVPSERQTKREER